MVKFVILSTQRSGSTFFRKYIGSHPQIDSRGEIFISKHWDDNGHEDRYYHYCVQSNFYRLCAKIGLHCLIVPAFLDSFYKNASASTNAKGFKLMYNQADKFGIFSSILKSENIVFIHFIRKNLLKMLVSRKLLNATNIAHSTVKLPQRTIELDTDNIIATLTRIDTKISLYKNRLRKFNALEVCYETFVENPVEKSKAVLQYLSLDTEVKLSTDLKKISSNNLKNVLSNYKEVKRTLMNTRFEKFIE